MILLAIAATLGAVAGVRSAAKAKTPALAKSPAQGARRQQK